MQVILRDLKAVGAIDGEPPTAYIPGMAQMHATAMFRLSNELARQAVNHPTFRSIDAVIAVDMNAGAIAQWIAYILSQSRGRDVLNMTVGDGWYLDHRQGPLIVGKNVLVVEETLTTGYAARQVVEMIRALGGHVGGVVAFCNCCGVTPKDIGVRWVAALLALKTAPAQKVAVCC